MSWEYSEKTKQIFMDAVHGKTGTHLGEIENPDGLGEHGSIVCGDAIRFTFRVERQEDPLQDVIIEARYLTFGCTSAIAASEALCAIIEKGRFTPIQALQISNQDIVDYLEGLPEQKIHCSVMGAEALEAAVFNWSQRRNVDLAAQGIQINMKAEDEGRIVCKCFSVSEPYLRRKIKELNLHSIAEITAAIKAGGACASCHYAPGGLQDILDEVWSGAEAGTGKSVEPVPAEPTPDEPAAMSPFQFMKAVEACLDAAIRPTLKADGGDLEIVDIKGKRIYCRLQGACASCIGASQTLKHAVEKTLREQVDAEITVIKV